jgi:hypothetical protein
MIAGKTTSRQEREEPMRISIVGKIMMALIIVSLIGGISVLSALGQDNYRRQGPPQRGYYDDRGRYDNRGWYDNRGRRVYRPHGYYRPGRVYGPPPAFVVPVPPPGISIFLPFDIR